MRQLTVLFQFGAPGASRPSQPRDRRSGRSANTQAKRPTLRK